MADESDSDQRQEPAKTAGARKKGAGRKGFLLRIPPELHEELRQWAATELRSLNGQIEFILRDALRRRRGGGARSGGDADADADADD